MPLFKFFPTLFSEGRSSFAITSELTNLTDNYQVVGGETLVSFGGEAARAFEFSISNLSITVENGGASIVGGRVTSITLFNDGLKTFSVTDMNLPAAAFVDAALANNYSALSLLLFKGDDRMIGTNFRDYLFGLGGDDTLFGRGGADIIWGDLGNDRIYGGGGADMLAGDSTPGALGDTRDQLFGGDGADTLVSNIGRDTVTGGAGPDTFVYYDYYTDRTSHRIVDFNADVDKIGVNGTVFESLGPDGVIDAELFRRGTTATEADDRLIYDRATGRLYFDPDGVGGLAKFLLYVLEDNPDLRANDIVLGSPF